MLMIPGGFQEAPAPGKRSERSAAAGPRRQVTVPMAPDGTTETILTGVCTPAAFDIDSKRQQTLVPLVRENRVEVAPLG